MNVEILTRVDFERLKIELIDEIKKLVAKPESQDVWLKNSDVKKILGCSEGTLVNLRNSGTLPYSKIGGIIYYRKQDLDNLFATNLIA